MVKLVQVLSLTESNFSNVSHLLDLELFERFILVEILGSKLNFQLEVEVEAGD